LKPVRNPRVKICCITSIEEAWLAIEYGATALGLVSKMPSGPGPIPEELIAKIARFIPPGTSVIQLVDRLEISDYEELRIALPGIKLVQVVHVVNEKAIDEAEIVAPYVDAILLDSGNPDLLVKQLGGTGRKHNWLLSRQIREKLKVPVFLAGGLNSDNVLEGLKQVHPFAVDVCNGVRTDDKLDECRLSAFFEAVDSYGQFNL
jgi:phosphoribosylanthranilate isomerase